MSAKGVASALSKADLSNSAGALSVWLLSKPSPDLLHRYIASLAWSSSGPTKKEDSYASLMVIEKSKLLRSS